MKIGYGRVSTVEQDLDAQRTALEAAGCELVFVDVSSGKLANRPELDQALLSAHRPGDQLVVTKLDRLGRSLAHLIDLSRGLSERAVELVVLEQGIDTSTPTGRTYFHFLTTIAEFEHERLSERTKDGLAAARARGVTGGQKPKLDMHQRAAATAMYVEVDDRGHRRWTVAEIGAEFGVSRATIYRSIDTKPGQRTDA